jgi:hypothetical protein
MRKSIGIFRGMRTRTNRLRIGALAVLVAFGAVLVGGAPASADDRWQEFCSGYFANVMVCVSYDYTSGYVSATAYNNNAADTGIGLSAVMVRVHTSTGFSTATVSANPFWGKTWLGVPMYWGRPPGADQVCGFYTVNSQLWQAQCGNFY